ncbi:hypothetical protein Q1B72_001755 [Salmonella enterica]
MMINDDGTYQPAFKNILFSSKEMIKACFTEDDYAKQSHCHDESWSILNLKINDESKDYYSWKFITKSVSVTNLKTKKESVYDCKSVGIDRLSDLSSKLACDKDSALGCE